MQPEEAKSLAKYWLFDNESPSNSMPARVLYRTDHAGSPSPTDANTTMGGTKNSFPVVRDALHIKHNAEVRVEPYRKAVRGGISRTPSPQRQPEPGEAPLNIPGQEGHFPYGRNDQQK